MNNNIIEENSADRIDSLKFEDLNTKDQLSKLESVYGELSKKFLEEYNDDIIRGNLFISDVSFARTSDNRPIFILSIVSRDGKEFTKYYDNELNKIDISQEQIDALKILNADTTDLQKEYDELKSLNTSPDKVSLKDLKEIDNQISATCKETGLSKDEVAKQLGIGLTSVHNLTKKGKLTVVKVNGATRYRQSEVSAIMDTKKSCR